MDFLYFRYVDDNKTRFIDVLREAVAIKSVSAWPEKRGEIKKQMEWAKVKLEALGAHCELHDIGQQVTTVLNVAVLQCIANISDTAAVGYM